MHFINLSGYLAASVQIKPVVLYYNIRKRSVLIGQSVLALIKCTQNPI